MIKLFVMHSEQLVAYASCLIFDDIMYKQVAV